MQQDTMLLRPNAVTNIKNEMGRKGKMFNFGTVKRLVLPLNVGQRNGQTLIGGINDSGDHWVDHWVHWVVELRPFKRILYCDTLAGKPPSNIIDVVNSYVSHIEHVGYFSVRPVCDWRCRKYQLQTCSDICGVIVLINAAVVALDRPLFQYLIVPLRKVESIYNGQANMPTTSGES